MLFDHVIIEFLLELCFSGQDLKSRSIENASISSSITYDLRLAVLYTLLKTKTLRIFWKSFYYILFSWWRYKVKNIRPGKPWEVSLMIPWSNWKFWSWLKGLNHDLTSLQFSREINYFNKKTEKKFFIEIWKNFFQ